MIIDNFIKGVLVVAMAFTAFIGWTIYTRHEAKKSAQQEVVREIEKQSETQKEVKKEHVKAAKRLLHDHLQRHPDRVREPTAYSRD